MDASYNDDIMVREHFPEGSWLLLEAFCTLPFSSGLFIAAAFWQCLMSSVKPKHSIFYHPFPSLCCPSTLNKANTSFHPLLRDCDMLVLSRVVTVPSCLPAPTFVYLSSSDTGGNRHRLPQQGDGGAPPAGGTWPPPLLPAAGKEGFRRVQCPDCETLRQPGTPLPVNEEVQGRGEERSLSAWACRAQTKSGQIVCDCGERLYLWFFDLEKFDILPVNTFVLVDTHSPMQVMWFSHPSSFYHVYI